MTLPVSSYEALLVQVRELTNETILLQQQLSSDLFDNIERTDVNHNLTQLQNNTENGKRYFNQLICYFFYLFVENRSVFYILILQNEPSGANYFYTDKYKICKYSLLLSLKFYYFVLRPHMLKSLTSSSSTYVYLSFKIYFNNQQNFKYIYLYTYLEIHILNSYWLCLDLDSFSRDSCLMEDEALWTFAIFFLSLKKKKENKF